MKFNSIIVAVVLGTILLSSCKDQMMEWYKDPTHGEVKTSELPLELSEKLGRYNALKTYTDFTLGTGIGLSMYMSDTAYRRIVNENFDEVTVGYEMKHGAMVKSTGALDFTNVDAFMAKTKEAGLTVFGHTLVWHSNQNASYLNGLIAPTVIPGSSGTNSLDLTGLKNGSFTNWNKANVGAGISVVDGAGLASTSKALKLISGSSSSNAWSLQLTTPAITVVSGHKYEVSFYIKSDQTGKGRLSFSGLNNNYPWKDWYATGGSWTEAFATTSQWQQVKITFAGTDFKAGDPFKFNFDLGYLPNITYYIDVNTISVVDKDAAPAYVNLIANPSFDTDLTGWAKWNGTDAPVKVTGTDAYAGGGSMKVVNATDNSGGQWKTQIHSNFTSNLVLGTLYTISFMVRSDAAGSIRCSTSGTSASYQGDQTTSNVWTKVEWKLTAKGGETGLNFDLGLKAGTYYIDDVLVTSGEVNTGSGPTIVEKTDAEKKTIVTNAMTDWISKMMGHYKADIKAWDVVNEPMKEDGTVRDGSATPAADEFFWVKYMGKDYAVTAFNLARQNGNGASDKLFINDYNLESSLPKCDGLIDYVKYIESKGATVDGIGTQMHISLSSDTVKIAQMFQKLAASGKLIKISELDIKIGTSTPTAVQLAAQAAMYQYVLNQYMKYIPLPQRYGVTAWGISDNAKEHEYWIPNDGPNLWDANYKRKHAYKGFADGLAGKDVSKDFSGELIIK